jgi:predicted PurR-regulated permease PerM
MLNMKRIAAGLLALSFIVGVLIVPIVHRMHRDGHHVTHEAARCSICQLTLAPIVATALIVAPIVGFVKPGNAVLPQLFIVSSPSRDTTQARAPPPIA